MTDIIWGNGSEVLSKDLIRINVTHRKDGNKTVYSDSELVKIIDADLPGLPIDRNCWTVDLLKQSIIETFLKCEVISKSNDGFLLAKVSHSGVGGY